MSDDPTGPGHGEDVGSDTAGGYSGDIGSSSSHGEGADKPHRAFGSPTPGADTPDTSDGDPDEAAGPTEGTPEDLKPGGDRVVDEDAGADAGDHGRETSP